MISFLTKITNMSLKFSNFIKNTVLILPLGVILKLNKKYLRQNIILANSINETLGIPVPRQREIMKRFEDYFGKYNDTIYPEGFRHLENFEVYSSVYPLKSISDYQSECNHIFKFSKVFFSFAF